MAGQGRLSHEQSRSGFDFGNPVVGSDAEDRERVFHSTAMSGSPLKRVVSCSVRPSSSPPTAASRILLIPPRTAGSGVLSKVVTSVADGSLE